MFQLLAEALGRVVEDVEVYSLVVSTGQGTLYLYGHLLAINTLLAH